METRSRCITLPSSHESSDFAEVLLHANSMLLSGTQNTVPVIDLLLCICYTETLQLSKFQLLSNSEQPH